MTGATEIKNESWVKESAFGTWFTGTQIWAKYVLIKALDDLEPMIRNRKQDYPVILDVGCGHGLSFTMLEKKFKPKRIIGLDIDSMTQSRAQCNIVLCQCKIQLQNTNASDINLENDSVDMLFCHQSFHHIVEQEQAMQDFFRILKPGGVLLFSESCRRYIHSFLIQLLFRHPMNVQKTDLEYIKLIRATGFELEEQNISRPFPWWSREDLGLLELLHLPKYKEGGEETMVNLVAFKPE